MDIERLNWPPAHWSVWAKAGCPGFLLLEQTIRVDRRAKTMEYIYFVILIAAVGVFLIVYWQISLSRSRNGGPFFGAKQRNTIPIEPPPPVKKTISGPSFKEMERIKFEEKVEMWQRGFGVRHGWHNRCGNDQLLTGKKYTYVPPATSRVADRKAAQPNRNSSPNSNGWQLIG